MNVIKLFNALSGLASIHRYSMVSLTRPESVLEHTGWVMFTANIIAREVNEICPGTIDISLMNLRAMVHDVDELIVGDIPRPTKYFSQEVRNMFKKIEERGVNRVVSSLELSVFLEEEMIMAHANSKYGAEGLIVAISDSLAVVHRVWDEVIVHGNCSMVRQAFTVRNQIDKLKSMIEEEFDGIEEAVIPFLLDILGEADRLMIKASEKDDPIHGTMHEEMIG